MVHGAAVESELAVRGMVECGGRLVAFSRCLCSFLVGGLDH